MTWVNALLSLTVSVTVCDFAWLAHRPSTIVISPKQSLDDPGVSLKLDFWSSSVPAVAKTNPKVDVKEVSLELKSICKS